MAARYARVCAGLVCVAFSCCVAPRTAHATPVYVISWNVCSSGGRPFGIAVDAAGYLYVTNQIAGTLEKFSRAGVLVARLAQSLNYPCGVAVASDGTISGALAALAQGNSGRTAPRMSLSMLTARSS